MPSKVLHRYSIAIAAVFSTCMGCCTHLHHIPDDCADTLHQCELVRAFHNLCSCRPCGQCGAMSACGCGMQVCEDAVVLDEPACCEEPYCCEGRCCCQGACCCKEALCRCCKVEPGPPPVCYKPPMPPKFLPVPTHSVFSTSHVMPISDTPPTVEVGFGPQLTIPGGN